MNTLININYPFEKLLYVNCVQKETPDLIFIFNVFYLFSFFFRFFSFF